ncbi:FxLYD domain-containing protein [Streptomyces sp. NPDC002788]
MAARHRTRGATGGTALAVALAAVLAGCGGDSPAETAREAESAVGSIASQASEAVESATAEAGRRLDDIQDGTDVKRDVKVATPAVGTDGRARAEVTVTNSDDTARSFAVQINFTDGEGRLRDTVLVNVNNVQPGDSAAATARTTHDLSGEVRAEVARAVRY